MPKEDVRSTGPENVVVRTTWGDGGVQVATLDLDKYKPGEAEAGKFASLDREGLNALIRNLRRARDRRYERDE